MGGCVGALSDERESFLLRFKVDLGFIAGAGFKVLVAFKLGVDLEFGVCFEPSSLVGCCDLEKSKRFRSIFIPFLSR